MRELLSILSRIDDGGVALGLASVGALLAFTAWLHGPTWCAWVEALPRREQEPAPADVGYELVTHATQHGEASALGWTVRHVGSTYVVCSPIGIRSTHRSAAAAVEAIDRRLRGAR